MQIGGGNLSLLIGAAAVGCCQCRRAGLAARGAVIIVIVIVMIGVVRQLRGSPNGGEA